MKRYVRIIGDYLVSHFSSTGHPDYLRKVPAIFSTRGEGRSNSVKWYEKAKGNYSQIIMNLI